tara:strand:- start:779 stop:982 length:204 start_codon:yes stop_codon:yes gene_type:complete
MKTKQQIKERNKLEALLTNSIDEAQIFEEKALDGRISKATRLHYLEVAKTARKEGQTLLNELMGWTE